MPTNDPRTVTGRFTHPPDPAPQNFPMPLTPEGQRLREVLKICRRTLVGGAVGGHGSFFEFSVFESLETQDNGGEK